MRLSILFLLVIVIAYAVGQADNTPQPTPPAPGRKVPGDPLTHTNSEELLEFLQGGNSDVFVVVFGVDAGKRGDLVSKINSDIVGKDHGWLRVTEVDLTKVQDYYKLLRVLKLEGEPKRGHTSPQVLVMSKGEGFVIRGPNIIDGILKRIDRVENGSLFGQGATGKVGGQGFSFGGRR